MFVQMLFGDGFIVMMGRLDVHLFIWKQKGRCVDLLAKSHSDVIVAVFMPPHIVNLTAETERAIRLLDVKMQNTYRIVATNKLRQIIPQKTKISYFKKDNCA